MEAGRRLADDQIAAGPTPPVRRTAHAGVVPRRRGRRRGWNLSFLCAMGVAYFAARGSGAPMSLCC